MRRIIKNVKLLPKSINVFHYTLYFVITLYLWGLVASLTQEHFHQDKQIQSINDVDSQNCDIIDNSISNAKEVCANDKYQQTKNNLENPNQHDKSLGRTCNTAIKQNGFKTIGTSKTRGRLGNHLWGYMLLLFVELKYGIQIFVENQVKESLTSIFKDLEDMKTLDDVCGYNEFFSQFQDVIEDMMKEWYKEKSGQNVTFTRKGQTALIDPPEVAIRYGRPNFETLADSEEFIQTFKVDYTKFPPKCPYKVTQNNYYRYFITQ